MKWWKLQSGDANAVERVLKSRYPEFVFECEDGVQVGSGQRTVEVRVTGMHGLQGGIVPPIMTQAKADDIFHEASKAASYFVHIWVVDAKGVQNLRSYDPFFEEMQQGETEVGA